MVALPPVVRRRAEQLGDAGVAWLAGLPDLIVELERQWFVTIGEPLRGGTAAYVARARTSSGSDVVVKQSNDVCEMSAVMALRSLNVRPVSTYFS